MKFLNICIYLLAISLIIGCQSYNAQEQEARQRPLNVAEQAENPRLNNNKTGQEVAEHLVHLAERVPEVQGAIAVVMGDLAVVGIDVTAELDRSDVGVVKYEVAEALKDDPHGAYAFISADPDINVRLREMQEDIQAGHPITGIMNELAAIVGRIIPIVPGPEHEMQDPEPTDANDDRLNTGEENQLEEFQEEHGRRNMDDENLNKHEENERREQNSRELQKNEEEE